METDFKNLMAQEIAQTFINFKKLGFKKDHGIGIRQSEFMLLTTLVQLSSESFKGIKISELGSQSFLIRIKYEINVWDPLSIISLDLRE